jgi:hypothetical protein
MPTLFIILSTLTLASNDAPLISAGDVLACDFEEASDRDYNGWPDGWTRQKSAALPEFLKIGIVAETDGHEPSLATPGRRNHCLRVELNGGGALVATPPRPVSPQFSLQLTARIKTAGLKHDGAWIELVLFDAQGNVVQTQASPPLTSCPEWQTVTLGPLITIDDRATSVTATLNVQPLGRREDLRGHVWFDDVRVIRLPRMQLIASSPIGVFTRRDAGPLVCTVSGIRVHKPSIRFELLDDRSQRLAESIEPLAPANDARQGAKSTSNEGYAGQASWTPPIPDYGFYRVTASLLAEGSSEALLDRSQTLAVLRPLAALRGSEFGWSLDEGEHPLAYGPLSSLLSQAGLGWAKMPIWYDLKETAKADRIAWFAEQLSIEGIELVGVLDQPPAELRSIFREQGRLPAASVFAEPELWQPAVGPVLTRLSLKVHWWQLGADGDASFVGYPQLHAKLQEIKRSLEQYGQQIHLGINWRWIYELPGASVQRSSPVSFLCQGSDPPLTAEEVLTYGAAASAVAARSQSSADLPPRSGSPSKARPSPTSIARPRGSASRSQTTRQWAMVAPLPASEYARDVRIRDLVMRMLAAKMASVHAVFLPQPFDAEHGIMNPDGSPGELFIPWRTTALLLGGAEYLGPLSLAGGGVGQLFARDGQAVLAVWSDKPGTELVSLGANIECVDVWGRSTTPAVKEVEGRSLYELPIGPTPIFVTGLSEAAARWQAAAAFENTHIASVAGREQQVILQLKNTFPQAVSGELKLQAPRNWGFDTRPMRFKIAEGEDLRLSIPVNLMPDASSGSQPVRLDFDVAGYQFSVHRTLHLGLDDVLVEITSRLKNGALLVEQHVTNLSTQPLSFQCVLFAPGRRREVRPVTNLGRERATLVFVLPRGEELIGQKLWLRAEEIGGSRVLNYTVLAER